MYRETVNQLGQSILRLFFYIKVDSGFPDIGLREGILKVTGESLGGQMGEQKGGVKS